MSSFCETAALACRKLIQLPYVQEMCRRFSISSNEFRYHQRFQASYCILGILQKRFGEVSHRLEINVWNLVLRLIFYSFTIRYNSAYRGL